ncbi:MAG TPA: SDR family oxidoreductase [Polyangiaceae bacterium]|nr:SDR family oxidoreductase [Polyangiaceae bacterium]
MLPASPEQAPAGAPAFGGPDLLRGKVAVVTGALGLLGREHCAALAAAGAHVVATDLDREALQQLAASLEDRHPESGVLGVAADVTQAESLDRLLDEVLARFGRLDVLVNNAAIDDKFTSEGAAESRFENYPLENFRRLLEVNVLGVFLCCQRLGRSMLEARCGSIINVASTYGIVAPNQSLYRRPDGSQSFFKAAAYPTSKGAVLQLTRYLAAYLGPFGVRVNALSPGGVDHDQAAHFRERYAERTPLGRMARASDYRGAVVFLASDASSYMTGANLVVDGGFTIW